MSGRGRAAIALVVVVVLGLAFALRPRAAGDSSVATFESTLHGETLRRGGFERGERVSTPAGGRVLVQTPGGARLSVEEQSEARFVTVDPLEVELVRGGLTARTDEEPLTLVRSGHRIQLREGAAAELLDGPPRLVVTSGTVTLDGRTVTGQRVLPSAP